MSKKMLIVCYSWSNGNTERVAKMLQKVTGTDMVQIETVVPYTGSYDDVVQQGQDEVQRGYEPEVKYWHGAAPDSWFSHIALEISGEDTKNEWCEPVLEEAYKNLK